MESDSDIFDTKVIYDHFVDELLWYNNGNATWDEFLKYKDLGLVYLGLCKYRIQDKKKWMLAKIKYGI